MRITKECIDDQGLIRRSGLHDSSIVEWSYRDSGEFILRLVHPDKISRTVSCLGVTMLATANFSLPNGIGYAFAWSPDRTPEGTRTLRDGAWNVLFGVENTSNEMIQDQLRRRDSAWLFQVLFTTEGCMALLCDEITID